MADNRIDRVDDCDDAVTDFFLGLGTGPLRFAADTGPNPRARTRTPRRGLRWLAAVGGALLLAAVVLTLVVVSRTSGSRTTPMSKMPKYPSVSGAAGQHLSRLERSIG